LLRTVMDRLGNSYDYVVMDNEAGMEHLSRRTTRDVQHLLIVSDPTSRGLETAALIRKMVQVDKVMECKKLGLVLNRVRGSEQLLADAASKLDLEVFGMIPYDETIDANFLQRMYEEMKPPSLPEADRAALYKSKALAGEGPFAACRDCPKVQACPYGWGACQRKAEYARAKHANKSCYQLFVPGLIG